MPQAGPYRIRIWLVETGPLAFAVARILAGGGNRWQVALALAGAMMLSTGGAVSHLRRSLGGITTSLGLLALLAAVAPALVTRPLLGFVLLFASIGLAARAFSPGILEELIGARASRLRADVLDIRLGALIALVTWLVGVAGQVALDPWIAVASAIASLLAGVRALAWARGVFSGKSLVLWGALAAGATLAAAVAAGSGAIGLGLAILALIPAATLGLARVGGIEIVDTSWALLVIGNPARLLVFTFLLLCVAGFLLLSLPIAAASGSNVSAIDAAFTAVSAVCVTGLITVDTTTAWSVPGQVIVLLLIQLGALGIMTLSTAALGVFGRRLSVRHEEAVASLVSSTHRGFLFVALRRTLAVTFAIEALGATILALLFWAEGDGFAQGLWRGVFTSISAFCNAGFALQADSLIPYQSSAAVLHVVGLLIIVGGLSPAVIVALPRVGRRKFIPLQVKIVLIATAALLLFGFAAFVAAEWENSLRDLSFADRLHNAWFQSVTFRTAGFNSVDFADLRAPTLLLSLALMFIGGAPGGTAGGIKTTTMWILGAAVAGALRGEPDASSFGRRISHDLVYRAIAITMAGCGIVLAVSSALLVTQDMPASLAVFETFSAVGTVGLSIGGTAELDGLGKAIIMFAMFFGRVGPLTAFLFLVERQHKRRRELLEENVEVG